MKRVILALLAAIAALAAVLAVRTVRFRPRVFDVIPAARVTVLPGAADRLAAAIRIPTISHGDSLLRDSAAFRQIR
jgi:hypothetical protein